MCFEETECDAGSWRVFPCQHGVCAKCFDGIVKAHVSTRKACARVPVSQARAITAHGDPSSHEDLAAIHALAHCLVPLTA